MPEDTRNKRYLELVQRLNQEQQWHLSTRQQQAYASDVSRCCARDSLLSDEHIITIIKNYHMDHHMVAVLQERDYAEHESAWIDILERIQRFLVSRTGGSIPDQAAVSIEDIAQEAAQDMAKGIQRFNYHSRFETWVFTIAANRLFRHYRTTLKSQKRQQLAHTQSLDALSEQHPDSLPSSAAPPEEAVVQAQLVLLVQKILADHPDQRLSTIFWMREQEAATFRAIGEQLNLSAARVHALLRHAILLLRNDPNIRQWLKDEHGEEQKETQEQEQSHTGEQETS